MSHTTTTFAYQAKYASITRIRRGIWKRVLNACKTHGTSVKLLHIREPILMAKYFSINKEWNWLRVKLANRAMEGSAAIPLKAGFRSRKPHVRAKPALASSVDLKSAEGPEPEGSLNDLKQQVAQYVLLVLGSGISPSLVGLSLAMLEAVQDCHPDIPEAIVELDRSCYMDGEVVREDGPRRSRAHVLRRRLGLPRSREYQPKADHIRPYGSDYHTSHPAGQDPEFLRYLDLRKGKESVWDKRSYPSATVHRLAKDSWKAEFRDLYKVLDEKWGATYTELLSARGRSSGTPYNRG